MKMKMKALILSTLLVVSLFAAQTLYAGESGVKLGVLEVKAIESTRHNLIIKSSVDVVAVFTDSGGNEEHYVGEMGIKLGVDANFASKETLEYAVFSASTAYKIGSYALQGKYFGQKAGADLGLGAEVQIFIGGFDKSFTLQPLAVGGTEGVGATVGLGYLYLQRDQ